MYRSCVVIFVGRETWVDLIIKDIVYFLVILGMDWLAFYHAILDIYTKIVTLAMTGVPKIS